MFDIKRRYFRLAMITALLLNFLLVAIAAGEPADKAPTLVSPYKDVGANDPNTAFIKYISQKGIISGFPDGTYHPAEGLSRAQAAVIICRAAALKTPVVNGSSFKDVPNAHWALPYVDAAAKAGYIKGFPDGSYQPDAKLSRSQAISLIMRLCTQKERAALPALQDMNSGHWAAADMATALALDMVQTSQDGKQIYPDKDMSRADLARALAVLLTKDPGLNQGRLTGTLTEIKGEVTLSRNNKTEKLTKDTDIYEGDIIQTGKDGRARIIYPDGSGNLLEENCEIAIKKADGNNYIKQDGTPGVAVDFLNIDLKKGTLFGALSTKTENKTEGQQTSLSSRVASRDTLRQLAEAEQAQPWYKTAEKKKVRMKVDMPWGVAAVRGTFIKVSVNQDGTCDVCCLSGTTDTTSNTGNIIINGGDKAVIKAENSAPEKGAMTADDKAGFAKEQEWVVNTALKMDTSRAAEVVVKTDAGQTVEKQAETTVKTVIDALKSSGIELKPEVIDKLKQDIQAELNKDAAESLIKDVDTGSNNTGTNNTNNTNNNSNNNNTNSNNTSSENSSSSSSSSSYVAYNQAGTYGGESSAAPRTIYGTVVINAPGVTLHNLVINGNLVLAATIGEGEATLQNVKVTGTTTVSGGGANSVRVENCDLSQVTVKKEGSIVHIIASGTTVIGPLTLESGAALEESGLSGSGFSSILTGQSLPSGTRIVLSGNFASLNISAPGLQIEVASGSIGAINLGGTATGTSLNLATGVTVSALEINSENVQVGGTGHIASAAINAAGISLAIPPASWTVKAGVTANIGGEDVEGSGSNDYAIRITAIPAQAVQVGKTITIPITTDPADATVTASVVTESSQGQADLSLSGNTLSVTGTVYGAVTIKVDAVKAGYTAASTTFTVTVSNISSEKSSWEMYDDDLEDGIQAESGLAFFYSYILDQYSQPVSGLSPNQFTIDVTDAGGTTTNMNLAQLPFGSFYYDDYSGEYDFSYFGSGSYTFSHLKVDGIPISYFDGQKIADSAVVNISGGATLTGVVTVGTNPLPGVKVEADCSFYSAMNYTFTGSDGRYSLRMPSNPGIAWDMRVRFDKPGYSCNYQDITLYEDGTFNATMALDSYAPDGIIINTPNDVSDEFTLTALGGPLSDASWVAIYNLIKAHTNSAVDKWISTDRTDCDLYLDDISEAGDTMTILVGYIDGYQLMGAQADILQDFVIPADLVVDRAGNQAKNDITIDSYCEIPSGLSATNSDWSITGKGNGIAEIIIGICDQGSELIPGLTAEQFTVVIKDPEGTTAIKNLAQLPFGGFVYDEDDGYSATYISNEDGEYSFSHFKVGGIPIFNDETGEEPATVNISGGLTLSGTVTNQDSQPLVGVKVTVAGSGYPGEAFNYTFTDSKGEYLLAIPGNCPLRIEFYKQGYDSYYQYLNKSLDYSLNAVMTVGNDTTTGITASNYNSFTNSFTLTAAGEPLSEQSWQDIFALIKANNNAGAEWMNAPDLWVVSISSDGNSMVLGTDGSATIKHDFIIPKALVVNRAGNPAAKDITIDSYMRGWTELGPGGLSNITGALALSLADDQPALACSGVASGTATVKKCVDGSWSSLGNPSTGAVQEIRYKHKNGYLNSSFHEFNYCAYVSGNKVNLASYENGAWGAEGGPTGSGESARLLQFTVDHVIYDYETPTPLIVFEDRYTNGGLTEYRGVARLYNPFCDYWVPAVYPGEVEQYFYKGDSALQALSMSDGWIDSLYIAFIDGQGQLKVTKWNYNTDVQNTFDNTYTNLPSIPVTGTVRPECGVAVAIDGWSRPYIAYADSNGLALAYYDGDNWTQLSRPGVIPGNNPIRLSMLSYYDNNDMYHQVNYVCFTDDYNRVTVMKCDTNLQTMNSTWQEVGEAGFAEIKPGGLQFCGDSNGVPYVAYLDANNQAHVVRYSMP